jgi:hypothetical protein
MMTQVAICPGWLRIVTPMQARKRLLDENLITENLS